MQLSARGGVSRWRQVRDQLAREIGGGRIKPGSRLAGELHLAEQYGVARQTIRQALARLEQEGLVVTRHGLGTFATDTVLKFQVGAQTWFEQNLKANQVLPSRAIHRVERLVADDDQARELAVEPGSQLLSVVIIGRGDGRPIGMGANLFPLARLRGLAPAIARLVKRPPATFSFFDVLAELGVKQLARQSLRLRARPATSEETAALEISPLDYLIETRSLIVDRNGTPAFHSSMGYIAGMVEFTLDP